MMMSEEMRELDEKEKKFVGKRLVVLRAEVDHLLWLKEYNDLMVSKGLYMNYLEKVREYEKNGKELKSSIKMTEDTAMELARQLDEGVKVKKMPGVV